MTCMTNIAKNIVPCFLNSVFLNLINTNIPNKEVIINIGDTVRNNIRSM